MSWGKDAAVSVVKNTGLGTPFINVTFSGLLWGYNDELPCMNLPRPEECGPAPGEIDIFAEDSDDDWGDGDDWKRKKRSAGRYKRETEEDLEITLKNVDFDSMQSWHCFTHYG